MAAAPGQPGAAVSEYADTNYLHIDLALGQEPPQQVSCDSGVVVVIGVAGVRRLFLVWNRGYKTMCFVAEDVHEALHLAVDQKHIRRAQQYRRFEDITTRATAEDATDQYGEPALVNAALNAGRSGAWCKTEGDWWLGGEKFVA